MTGGEYSFFFNESTFSVYSYFSKLLGFMNRIFFLLRPDEIQIFLFFEKTLRPDGIQIFLFRENTINNNQTLFLFLTNVFR